MDEAVEIARTALSGFSGLDPETAARLFAEDAEWHNTMVFPGKRVLRGPAEIAAFGRELAVQVSDWRLDIEREAVADDGAVVLGLHSRGTTTASGFPLDVRWAVVVRVRDGAIVRIDVRGDFDKALATAGLA